MEICDYETNTLVVSNIASVAFRVYCPILNANSSIFTFSSADVEKSLRNDGHLVFADSRRRVIWCFRLLRKDGSTIGSPSKSVLGAVIDVGPHKLRTVDDGGYDVISLLRGRPNVPNAVHTPNSSSSSSIPPSSQSHGLPPSSQGTTASIVSDLDGHNASVTASEPRTFPRVPTKVVYNFLISAILASLSTTYCSRARAIALNSRTFLLPPLDPLWDGDERSRTDRNALVATLRVSLTTGGSLLVGVSHSILQGIGCSEWACFAGVPPTGVSVLAAPWGKFGTVRGIYPPPLLSAVGQGTLVRSKKMQQTLAAVPQMWKAIATKMLLARGTSTSVLQDSTWLKVEFVLNEDTLNSKTISILWPSVLCFWSLESSVSLAPPYQNLDALSETREAYLEEIRGEEAASKVKDSDIPMEDAQASLSTKTGPITQSFLGVGPAANATAASNAVSAATAAATASAANGGAIYPTPPDGVPNPVGVTPTFEGSTSSPGNLTGTAAAVDSDVAMANTRDGDASLDDFWTTGNETKRDPQSQSFMVDSDNMFGGLGNDIFGDNITDADFNFFDDKPDGDGSLSMPIPIISGAVGSAVDDGMHLNAEPIADLDTKDIDLLPIPEPLPAEEIKEETVKEAIDEKPPSPVFAKPELKHARSNLGGLSANSNGEGPDATGDSGIKRPSSPFDAMTVFKRIRAEAEGKTVASGQNKKRFEGLKFTDFMIENNKKYERNGKFGFHWPYPEADMLSDVASATSPTAFRRPVKKLAGPADPSPEWGALISSITRGMKSSSLRPQHSLLEDGGDTSSGSSEDGSSSGDSDDDEPLVASMSQRQLEASVLADALPAPDGASELSRAYSEGVWDFPISRYFADPMPPPEELAYSDEDVIEVAQILTQQISRATIRSAYDEDEGQNMQKQKLRHAVLQRIRNSVSTLQGALPAALDEATRCALKPYLEVKDVPLLIQPSRLQSRLPPGSEQLWSNLYGISTPHVELRRHEWTLSVVPPAIEFWEVLGLEPLNGAKEIRAVCMYPYYEGLAADVDRFLGRMRIVYESLRLGTHERLSPKTTIAEGMVAFDSRRPGATTPSGGPVPLRREFAGADQIHKLAQALALEDAPGKSLVVYFVYCSDVTGAIVDACLAFQRLSQLYEMAVTSRNTEHKDLVLQLIPSSFVASPTSLAVPSPTDLLRLCLEVYDRCASAKGPKPAPAFLLEQPPPRMLDLKLSPAPSVDVQRENSFIHVAYALSADSRWVTVAWTDATGWRQFSSAYWIGRKGKQPENSFATVAAEIWDNTCAIVANLKVHWRAVIAKCGPMEPEEMEVWVDVTRGEKRASVTVTLVSVDTRPNLELLPPVTTVSPSVLSQLHVATPAPTPQASVFSPEPTGNPATPAGSTGLTNPATPAGAATPATPSGGPGMAGTGGPSTNSPVVANTPGAAAAAAAAAAGAAGGAIANSTVNNNNNNPANNPALAALAAAASDPNAVSEIDGNVVLVDISDTAWGAVASHRLNTASTWVDLRPALVSGYLIKRGGIHRDDAPVVLEVNLVRSGLGSASDSNSGNNANSTPGITPSSPRAYEVLVREILSAYRGLGTLARTRGILDSERDARPWHVAAVERSAKALCQWM